MYITIKVDENGKPTIVSTGKDFGVGRQNGITTYFREIDIPVIAHVVFEGNRAGDWWVAYDPDGNRLTEGYLRDIRKHSLDGSLKRGVCPKGYVPDVAKNSFDQDRIYWCVYVPS